MLKNDTFDKSQIEQLKGLHNAENHSIRNLPSGFESAFKQVLNRMPENDPNESQAGVESLEQIFFDLDENPPVKKSRNEPRTRIIPVLATDKKLDETVGEAIMVDAPASQAYNPWTQFDENQLFMEGAKEVKQLDDKRLRWKAGIAGEVKEWERKYLRTDPQPAHRLAQHGRSEELRDGQLHFSGRIPIVIESSIWAMIRKELSKISATLSEWCCAHGRRLEQFIAEGSVPVIGGAAVTPLIAQRC
jgi:Domain of unknown function (DUF892)